jgi:hypothetical protein
MADHTLSERLLIDAVERGEIAYIRERMLHEDIDPELILLTATRVENT